MSEIEDLTQQAKAEMEAIFCVPIPDDPNAPAGFLTAGFAELEVRRRFTAAAEVIERYVNIIERRFGPVPGARVREHLALSMAVLRSKGGGSVH